MTDLVKEMNLSVIELAATNVQTHVEEAKTQGLSKQEAERYVAPAATKLMTPIVDLALKNKVPGDEILEAIHKGSEDARQNK